jgi:hypothetical protein
MIWRALDRLRAADPGWVRARAAVRVVLAILAGSGLATGLLALGRGPARVAIVGTVTALMATLTVPPGPARARAAHVARVTLAAGASAVAAAAAPSPVVADVLFVALIGAAAWASCLGQEGTAIGLGAFMAHAIVRLLRLDPPTVPWVAAAAIAGGLGSVLAGLAFLSTDRAEPSLRRLLPAFAVRLDGFVATLIGALAVGLDEPRRERIRDRLASVQEVALQIDAALDQLPHPSPACDHLREEVLRLEVLADHLAWSVNTRTDVAPAPREAVQLARCWRTGPTTVLDPDRLLFLPEGAHPATTARVLARMALAREALAAFRAHPPPLAQGGDAIPASPIPPPPAAPAGRKVVQACLAGAAAMALGRQLSPTWWVYAVMGAVLVILTTPFRGAAMRRALDRTLGTALGVALGLGLGTLMAGHSRLEILAVVALLFGAYWLFPVSYAGMMLLVTAVSALAYELLGRFDLSILLARLSETALGAIIGIVVTYLVLPSTSRAAIDGAVVGVLDALDDVLAALAERAAAPSLRDRVRQLDRAVASLWATTQPLVTSFPIPIRDEVRAARLLAVTTRFRARVLATALTTPEAGAPLDRGVDDVLAAVRNRIRALRADLDPARPAPPPAPGDLAAAQGPIADIFRAIDARLVTWQALREACRARRPASGAVDAG